MPHITDALQEWIVDVSKKPVDGSGEQVRPSALCYIVCTIVYTAAYYIFTFLRLEVVLNTV